MNTTKYNHCVQPYLFFNGNCEQALEFYRKAIGAEVEMMMRFKESPEKNPNCMPADDNKVMHAAFKIGDTTVMASDGNSSGNPSFQGISLSLTVPNDAEAERIFGLLEDGGKVLAPLVPTFFSSRFGMVADRFGVNWMIVVMA